MAERLAQSPPLVAEQVGKRGMGALEFRPARGSHTESSAPIEMKQLVEEARRLVQGSFAVDREAKAALANIIKVGTSAGGARAKAEEQASGKNTGRPQLEGCLKSLREGDTLVVWRLDRLGRNLADLVRLISDLESRKINFESLTEKIETGSPAGRLVFHVFAALAEFERNLIRERTMAGLTAARARGRTGGRPSKLSVKEVKTIRGLLKSADMPVAEIASRFGIARSTLYRAVLKSVV